MTAQHPLVGARAEVKLGGQYVWGTVSKVHRGRREFWLRLDGTGMVYGRPFGYEQRMDA